MRFLSALLLFSTAASAALVSRVSTFVDGQILTADGINGLNVEFNNVVDGTNSLDDSNFSLSANISPTKLGSTIAGSGLSRSSSTGVLSLSFNDDDFELLSNALTVKDGGVVAGDIALSATDDSTLTISSGKIAVKDGGITQAKRAARATGTSVAAGGVAASGSSGTFSNDSATPTDITNMSVTITTTGRPVVVKMISTNSGAGNVVIRKSILYTEITSGFISFLRDSTTVALHEIAARARSTNDALQALDPAASAPCSAFKTIDVPAAGTYTYKAQAYAPQNQFIGNPAFNDTIDVLTCQLVAYEL